MNASISVLPLIKHLPQALMVLLLTGVEIETLRGSGYRMKIGSY